MTTTSERVVPPHVVTNPRLGTWIGVADGVVLVQVGKVELGQGILTVLGQIAADALGLPLSTVRVAPATTSGPDQGLTAGSLSVFQSFPALRHLGAVVRALAGPPDDLAAYVARIADLDPDLDLTRVEVDPDLVPRVVGTDAERTDLPDKVLGRPRFLTDLRPDGLLFGRVLRPPSPAATLASLAEGWSAPGVSLVRDGSFLGVVGSREDEVDRALSTLAHAAAWDEHDSLPDEDDLPAYLRSAPSESTEVVDESP